VNLPNALTLLRIFLVPVLVAVLLTRKSVEGLLIGAGIFGVGVLTDYLDGYFARRRNQITRLGILLDPIADKLLTAAALLSLVELHAVPAWVVLIVLGRELAVTGLRNLGAARGLLIPASRLGKGKMVSQVVAIFLLLLSRVVETPAVDALAWAALWVMVVIVLVSGLDYFHRFGWQVVRAAARSEEPPAQTVDSNK
jgi:CDP-diacylglycerol---glycerol-3-phosphate 3-phosphatidyltransferase